MELKKLLSGMTLAMAAGSVFAVPIASDDFQSYAVGELNGQNGGTGWSSAWQANTARTDVVDPAVDLQGNRAASFTGNLDSSASRTLASAFTGNDIFVSFLLQLPTGTSIGNNDFLAIWFQDGATYTGTNRPMIGLKGNLGTGAGASDLFVRTTGTDGSFIPDSDLAGVTTYRIVGHLYRTASSGNYTNFDAWLNPVVGDLLTPDAIATGNANIGQLTTIGLRTANLDAGDQVLIDNLVLSSTWGELFAVPEPGMLATFGIGLLGFGLTRRRQA